MLKILRKKGVMRKLLWILAVVIILAFGFLGQAYLLNRGGRENIAGRIYGRTVSLEDFQHHLEQVHLQAVMQYGQNLQKVLPYLNLESQAWDRIIALHEARKRKIRIVDEEVVNTIRDNPFFQKDGRFDRDIYQNVLYALRMTPRQYEEGLRESLKISRLFRQITSDLDVTEQETLQRYKLHNEKTQISYIFFPNEKYTQAVVPDLDAIRTYYKNHKSEFMQPPRINVHYLSWPYPPEATQDDKDEILDEALEVAIDLRENPDLAAVAQTYELELQSTGFFSMEKPVLREGWSFSLIQQLFQKDVGFISDPVETAQGIDILQISAQKEAEIPEFDAIAQQAQTAWIQSQARELAQKDASQYLQRIRTELDKQNRESFVQFAKDNGLDISQTPIFTRNQYLPKLGPAGDFKAAAFKLEPEQPISPVVATAKGYAILHLDSKIPVDIEKFEKEKTSIAEEILSQKGTEAFNEFISQLRQEARLEDNISPLMEQQKKASPPPPGEGDSSQPSDL